MNKLISLFMKILQKTAHYDRGTPHPQGALLAEQFNGETLRTD